MANQRLHFYRMQFGGNAFVLIDDATDLQHKDYSEIAKQICSRRFGVGASGCIFMHADNSIDVFDPKGFEAQNAFDAYFCAARFAFDSGRIEKTLRGDNCIKLKTQSGENTIAVISSREFSIDLGSAFSLASGKVLTPEKADCIDTIQIDGKQLCVTGIHIYDDVLVALPESRKQFSFFELYLKLQKNFKRKKIYLTFARAITKESILVRTLKHGLATCTTSAASSLIATWFAGATNKEAVCIFEYGDSSVWTQQEQLSKDKDGSRKVAIIWDTEKNALQAIGTGGYLFEGYFDK